MNDVDYLFFIGILMLPTNIAQIVPKLFRKNTAPFFSFIFCNLCNIGYGFLISYFLADIESKEYYLNKSILFLVLGFLPQIFPLTSMLIPNSFEGNFIVLKEIFNGVENRQSLFEKLNNNRAFAPVITVTSEAYHKEYYTETVYENGHSRERRKYKNFVSFRSIKYLRYNSWEEEGEPIPINKSSNIVHVIAKVSYKLDDDAKNTLENMRRVMHSEALCHDRKARVKTSFEVPGLTDSCCGVSISSKDEKVPPFVSFLSSSIWGKVFLVFMSIIGYQSVVCAIWCSYGERIKVKIVKKISMRPNNPSISERNRNGGLRAGYLEKDVFAAEKTFCSDDFDIKSVLPKYDINHVQQPLPETAVHDYTNDSDDENVPPMDEDSQYYRRYVLTHGCPPPQPFNTNINQAFNGHYD